MTCPRIVALALCAASGFAAEGIGLAATYYDNVDFTGYSVSRVDPKISFGTTEWPGAVPAAGIAADWWSAIWVGSIEIPATDTYTFSTWSDDGIVLLIDGKPVLENWTGHARTLDRGSIALTAGRHSIQVRYYNSHGGACLDLLWASSTIAEEIIPQRALYAEVPPPVIGSGTGLAATYFDEDGFGGFSATKIDKTLDFTWDGARSPARSIAPDAWSAKWVGEVQAQYTDTYTISALTNHPFSLAINGLKVIDDPADGVERTAVGKVFLKAGQRYELLATYRSTTSPSRLAVSWSCPLTTTMVIPSTQFYPTSERQAAKLAVLSPLTTYTSPAWIEGSVGHWTTSVRASVNGVAVPVVAESASQWYLNTLSSDKSPGIPLSGTLNLLSVNAVNGKTKQSLLRPILWKTLNVASLPYGMDSLDVRPGDTIRLTATGKGKAVAVDVDNVDGAAFTPEFTGRPGQVFAASFPKPGIYKVVARIDGKLAGSITIRVPSVDLRGPIACHINYRRIKDIGLVENGASVELTANDAGLMDVEPGMIQSDGVRRLALRPLNGGALALRARLGNGGPIVTQCPVDEFTIRTTAEKYISLVGTLPNGKQILEAQLIMSPLVKNLDVKLSMYTGGVTFEDSSLVKMISTNEFAGQNGDGNCVYRMIRNPGAAACHNIDVFQSSVQISDR